MPVHTEVLDAARRLCRERSGWTFRPDEIVRALPHLNPSTVRTHIVSRCCVNAPEHHLHRWAYFKRVARGVYEVLPGLRHARTTKSVPARPGETGRAADAAVAARTAGGGPARARRHPAGARVAEAGGVYGRGAVAAPRDTVHAVVIRDKHWYVAECLELAVVTQGRTLDELVTNLREAIALHLEGEEPASTGVVARPRVSLTYEVSTRAG